MVENIVQILEKLQCLGIGQRINIHREFLFLIDLHLLYLLFEFEKNLLI
jgi:hypothetical protein